MTSADIRTLVGFPIPPFPLEDDSDRSFDPDSVNPLRFWVRVDGKPLPVKMQRRVDDGEVHLIYHWEQVFPASKTIMVEHRYAPAADFGFLIGSVDEDLRKAYCVDADMQRSVKARLGTQDGPYGGHRLHPHHRQQLARPHRPVPAGAGQIATGHPGQLVCNRPTQGQPDPVRDGQGELRPRRGLGGPVSVPAGRVSSLRGGRPGLGRVRARPREETEISRLYRHLRGPGRR